MVNACLVTPYAKQTFFSRRYPEVSEVIELGESPYFVSGYKAVRRSQKYWTYSERKQKIVGSITIEIVQTGILKLLSKSFKRVFARFSLLC